MGMGRMWLNIVYLLYQRRGTYLLPWINLFHVCSFHNHFSYNFLCCRISITFRKMDESRLPYKYSPDRELLNVRPLAHRPLINTPLQQQKNTVIRHESRISQQSSSSPHLDKDDFPPLGAWKSDSRKRGNKNGLRQWAFPLELLVSCSFASLSFS